MSTLLIESPLSAGPSASALLARDRGLVWHPYAALDGPSPYAVRAASGVRLDLEAADGTRFDVIDAMSSWWCCGMWSSPTRVRCRSKSR